MNHICAVITDSEPSCARRTLRARMEDQHGIECIDDPARFPLQHSSRPAFSDVGGLQPAVPMLLAPLA